MKVEDRIKMLNELKDFVQQVLHKVKNGKDAFLYEVWLRNSYDCVLRELIYEHEDDCNTCKNIFRCEHWGIV